MSPEDEGAASGRTFAALDNREFRWIWTAASFSHLGGAVQITAAAWLMTTMTQSPLLIAMVQTCAYLPAVAFSLIAGAVADLFNKRIQMTLSVGLRVLAVFTLALLVGLNMLEPWSLLLLTALIGTGAAFYNPSWQASLREIVSRERLISAISLNSLSFNVARCAGPALGGELIVIVGAGMAMIVSGVSFVVLFMTLVVFWPRNAWRADSRDSVFEAAFEGVRYAAGSSVVRVILLKAALFAFSGSALLSLPPVIALELGGGPRTFAALVTSFGVGAALGALAIVRISTKAPADVLVFACSIVVACSTLAIAFNDSVALCALLMLLAGGGWVNVVSTLQRAIQTLCPHGVVGRTIALLGTVFSLGVAGGSFFWGWMVGAFGLSISLTAASASLALGAWIASAR